MKCPVCNRNLAPTLSICLTCGTMMNDSVREELQSKVSPVSGSLRTETRIDPRPELAPPPKPLILETRPQPAPAVRRVETAGLNTPKTSPTLVDFQHKNGQIPEWRLQMQNAVRQRRGISVDDGAMDNETPIARVPLATRGATALKAEVRPQADPLPELENADPRLVAAMKRISDSRSTFLPEESKATAVKVPVAKSFPFNVVAPTPNPPAHPPMPRSPAAERPKPAMVTPLRMEKKLDTNKLPRIETIVSDQFDVPRKEQAIEAELPILSARPAQSEFSEVKRIVINAEHKDDEIEDFEQFEDEIEDLAPFSMRFNAGLFDLIIGVFASMVLLSPVVLAGGNWLNTSGILTFAGTCAIVMFLYMTASIGFVGKTLGMRLFSLELVDAEENEYPTIHQAAVSSSLYILSLVLLGAGFISVFFNEEKRAIHDLLSGTIIVREF